MPYNIYLKSGIIQSRLRKYDIIISLNVSSNYFSTSIKPIYQPSLPIINFYFKYSITKLSIFLFIFALFINSIILIITNLTLSSNSSITIANLFNIHIFLFLSFFSTISSIFTLILLLSDINTKIIYIIAK